MLSAGSMSAPRQPSLEVVQTHEIKILSEQGIKGQEKLVSELRRTDTAVRSKNITKTVGRVDS